jgi:hypothetical protein
MNKEMRAPTIRELEDWPGVTMTEEDGGKHAKAVLHFNGQSRVVIVSKTPSDARALPNHLATVRREIRALGAERAHVLAGAKQKTEPPANPVLTAIPKSMEAFMSREAKQEAIFRSIGDLRYSEMLSLAEFLRDVATEMNLRRGNPHSWAQMLQAAVDCQLAAEAEALKTRAA